MQDLSFLAEAKVLRYVIPNARYYKPRLVFFLPNFHFGCGLCLILQTIYVLKMEILHFLSSKSAAYKQERLQIESSLWWRAYGIYKKYFKTRCIEFEFNLKNLWFNRDIHYDRNKSGYKRQKRKKVCTSRVNTIVDSSLRCGILDNHHYLKYYLLL